MYEECVCEIFVSEFFFFISKTFFEFAGTSQKWVKNRLPRSLKKSKIIDFAVFEPFFRKKYMKKHVLGRFTMNANIIRTPRPVNFDRTPFRRNVELSMF